MKEDRSIFWPLTFIAAGVLWLAINMSFIPSTNLWALAHIWPYLLIALGVGLILRSFWRPFGMIVSALVVITATMAVYYAPQLGWDNMPAWQWNFDDNSSVGAIPGSGVKKLETRKVENFDAVTIRVPAEVVIQQGEANSLIIETDDNLLSQLSSNVISGKLVIENTENNPLKRVKASDTVKITLTVKSLKEIDFPTAGKLIIRKLDTDKLILAIGGAVDGTITGLKTRELRVDLSGAGNISADGIADNVYISISGFGNFDGQKLVSQIANILISGAGNASLRVEKELTAQVSGAGSVNYYGDPAVNESISGVGSVNKAGD